MGFVQVLPFFSTLDNELTDCGLWKSDENICEFQTDKETGICDPSGFYYGTTDSREPKFCARHFYQRVVNGDGYTNYALVDE